MSPPERYTTSDHVKHYIPFPPKVPPIKLPVHPPIGQEQYSNIFFIISFFTLATIALAVSNVKIHHQAEKVKVEISIPEKNIVHPGINTESFI